LLLIETSRAYGRGLVEGIIRYAEENGPWALSFEERELNDRLPRSLRDWRGQGIISRTTQKRDLDRLLAKRVPLVELYAGPKPGLRGVFPDEAAIARLAVEHFLDLGLREFGFFCAFEVHWIVARRAAFQESLRERGYSCHTLPFVSTHRAAGRRPASMDQQDVIRWIRGLPKPCGVLCAADFHAAQLLQAARACGIAVPEQIAILGVDNDPVFCGASHPQLSSINPGALRVGYEAAALLARMMSGKVRGEDHVFVQPVGVVTRESTDILAIDDTDVAHAVRIIREHACKRLRVSDVAEAVGLSRRVLEQRFQGALHRSPKEEILRVRLQQAKMLLATSNLAIALVAPKCGFTSQEYFARVFKQRIGTTPAQFRRRHLSSGSDTRFLR
jgi:LacI family transcriptional regulator